MARQKVGLDYFDLDCHMDEKVKLIEAEYGLKGFAIIVKLYQSIYSGFGYYCEWTPDISVLWAYQLGCIHSVEPEGRRGNVGSMSDDGVLSGFPKNLINEVVAASIRRNIFSEELFRKYRILTSSGIQKRYLNATVRRERVELKKEYLLISVGKNRGNVVINSVTVDRNEDNVCRMAQSREEKSREEDIPPISPVNWIEDFLSVYPKVIKNRNAVEVAYCRLLVTDAHLTESDLITAAKNYADACRILETEDRYIKAPQNFLKDNFFASYLTDNYHPPEPAKRKNNFNQFQQNNYDFEALERDLLSR